MSKPICPLIFPFKGIGEAGSKRMIGTMTAGSLFKATKPTKDITVGSVFRHRLPGSTIETATVLGVENDFMGIPHVIYDVTVGKSGIEAYCDRRTLALQSFSDYFDEALSA